MVQEIVGSNPASILRRLVFMNDRICLSVAAQYTDGTSESALLPHRILQPPQRLWNCSHALSNGKYRQQSDEYQYQSPDDRYLLYFGSNYRTDARFGCTPRGFSSHREIRRNFIKAPTATLTLLNAAVHRTRRLLQTRCLVRHAQQI